MKTVQKVDKEHRLWRIEIRMLKFLTSIKFFMASSFGRYKLFSKSGGYVYISESLLKDLPFENGEKVRLQVVNGNVVCSRTEWYELFTWEENKDAYKLLPQEIKEKIQQAGILTKPLD